jgi:hypothetical protein
MRRCSILAISGIVITVLAAFPGGASSQQKTLKDQLVRAWALASIDYVRADGSRSSTFGDNPKGIAFFDGRNYIITVMRADRAKYAINDRAQGTAEENKATAQGTITYFGTYSVNETDRSISIRVVGSSFPNWNGTDQKRIVALSGDKLALTNPVASTGGGTTEVVFTRAR